MSTVTFRVRSFDIRCSANEVMTISVELVSYVDGKPIAYKGNDKVLESLRDVLSGQEFFMVAIETVDD